MKNRSYTILTLCMLYASFTNAQDKEDKTTFGILGGVNFQNLSGKAANGNKLENKMIVGYHAGFNVQIPVAPEFYFQPGILFSTKGGQNVNDSFTSKVKLSYIEMPLNFLYRGLLGSGHVLLGFGPYIGYGIGGKVITERGSSTTDEAIKFQSTVELNDPNNTPYFKAFDAGANIFAGYELSNGIFFQLNTQFGMVKINPENKKIKDDKTSIKNSGFGLSLGYRF